MSNLNLLPIHLCSVGVWLLSSQWSQAFYNPSAGRWISRDPIEERGGKNLYGFVANDPVRTYDALGKVLVIYPTSASGDVRPMRAEVSPILTASDVCHGGPLHFQVSFSADYDTQGANVLSQYGIWFSYGGARTDPSNYRAYEEPGVIGIKWEVLFSKALPVCPTGRQSGSMEFASGEPSNEEIKIIFDWHYRCDCSCNEVEQFKPSYTYFFFPPVEPPPRPRPGRPIQL